MSTNILLVRLMMVLVIGVSVWVGMSSYQSFKRTKAINQEIHALEDQANRIKQENVTLREKIEYFSSDSFAEREAKEKLGLKKSGEQVVIIKSVPNETDALSISPMIGVGRSAEFQLPNYYKWWRKIFGNQRPRSVS